MPKIWGKRKFYLKRGHTALTDCNLMIREKHSSHWGLLLFHQQHIWGSTQEGIPLVALLINYTILKLKMENRTEPWREKQHIKNRLTSQMVMPRKCSPGASAAAVELLSPGCWKRGEGKAWTADWAMVAIRGAPLGMNSLAVGFGALWYKKGGTKHKIYYSLSRQQRQSWILNVSYSSDLLIQKYYWALKTLWVGRLLTHLSPLGNAESAEITEQWRCWRVHWICESLQGVEQRCYQELNVKRYAEHCRNLTMSAVAEVLGTIIK